MGFAIEFKDFLKKYQVLGLAVAFIIGAASTKLVTAFVNDVVMPIVAVLVPGGEWRTATFDVGSAKFLVGDLAGALIDFLIVAFVVFSIVKFVMREDATAKR
ncbi:MAG: MscL family protein [Candidatus Micrarchaeia archaeon]